MLADTLLRKFVEWTEEDAPQGDETSEVLIDADVMARAEIVAKGEGVLAAMDEICEVLPALGLKIIDHAPNGTRLVKGQVILTMEGPAARVLLLERPVLNVLSHCSGVASTTRRLVDEARKHNKNVRIAATRKTIPGLRFLDKEAVRVGGGDTHRLSLSHTPLIKDNHLRVVKSIEEAVSRARARSSFVNKIEIEVATPRDAVRAAKAGADIVMLDNFSPDDARLAVEMLKKQHLRERVQVEASGGITEANVGQYAALDVDVISSGKLTHSPGIVDMSLEVVKSWRARE